MNREYTTEELIEKVRFFSRVRKIAAVVFVACSLAFAILTMCAGCAANHCRADQRMPEGATFDDLKEMTREQCK